MKKQTLQLPLPASDAIEHSQKLTDAIIAEIQKGEGQITFKRYMEMTLFEPGLGYYVSGSQKFGASGDFVTAPEISSLFSCCLARQCREIFSGLETGQTKQILEFGAGSGVMAADILLEMEKLDLLPDFYCILEVSAELQQRQQETISQKAKHLLDKVVWIQTLPENDFSGIVLANEVLDAMPVHRFYKDNSNKECSVGEYYVSVEDSISTEGSHFAWRQDSFSNEALKESVSKLQDQLPDSYSSEINLAALAWVKSVADFLQSGVVIIIDYGFPRQEYYHPQRAQGTLMCHYRHHSHPDPFVYPGLQDITAHVDFTAVAEAADAAGLDILGYTNQAFFLLGNRVEDYLANMDTTSSQYMKLSQQLKTLTMPGEMGELFKVMALGKSFNKSLQGFSLKDDRNRL